MHFPGGLRLRIYVLTWPAVLVLSVLCLAACSSGRSVPAGVQSGRLSPCPSSPNCVSSQTDPEDSHYTVPLPFEGSAAEARQKIVSVVNSMDRTKITINREDYLHAEFTSRLFRFVDDVEFLLDERERVVHVRSASRLGYSDLGVNRKRVEEIRRRFQSLHPQTRTKEQER